MTFHYMVSGQLCRMRPLPEIIGRVLLCGTSEKRPNLRRQGAKNEGINRSVVKSLTIALIYMYSSASIPEKGRKAPVMPAVVFARPLQGDRDSRRQTWHTAGFHFSSNPGIGLFGTQIDI